VPEHEAVVAAKLAEAVIEERLDGESPLPAVVERLVAQHHEAAGEIAPDPGEIGLPVKRVVVLE
jgi:hypothetical protein